MAATVNEIPAEKFGGNPRWEITSDKFNHVFSVEKSFDGFVFYRVAINGGSLPKELQGMFTRASDAIKAVKAYEDSASPSATVVRDRKADARAKEKADKEALSVVEAREKALEGADKARREALQSDTAFQKQKVAS